MQIYGLLFKVTIAQYRPFKGNKIPVVLIVLVFIWTFAQFYFFKAVLVKLVELLQPFCGRNNIYYNIQPIENVFLLKQFLSLKYEVANIYFMSQGTE